jgi:hypothetical protein
MNGTYAGDRVMNATSLEIGGGLARGANMPPGRLLRAYLTEAKYESVRMLRSPAFGIPFLGLPVALYLLFAVLLFGDAIRSDPKAAMFTFTGFDILGVMGPGLFGFGIVVAMEREQGLLTLKRALPMPPAAYLLAKMLMAMLFGVIVTATIVTRPPAAYRGPMLESCGDQYPGGAAVLRARAVPRYPNIRQGCASDH